MSEQAAKILSDKFLSKYKTKQPNWGYNGLGYVVYKRTYARVKPDGRTEDWWETVARCVEGAQKIGAEYTREEAQAISELPADQTMVDRLVQQYDEADPSVRASGHGWYANARRDIQGLADNSGMDFKQGAAVVAALSPQQDWPSNIKSALKATAAVIHGDEIPSGLNIYGANVDKAIALAQGEDPAVVLNQGEKAGVGRKVWNFYNNLIGDDDAITLDRWAVRAAGIQIDEPPRGKRYRDVSNAYRKAALIKGVSPNELQAVVWLHVRGEKGAKRDAKSALISNASPAVDQKYRLLAAQHAKDGGLTFNEKHGDMADKPFFAVSVYPDRGEVVEGKDITPQQIAEFVRKNQDLLKDPENSLGTWFNADDGKTYLDISKTVSDRQYALKLAEQHDQKAIWDLKNKVEIPSGLVNVPLDEEQRAANEGRVTPAQQAVADDLARQVRERAAR